MALAAMRLMRKAPQIVPFHEINGIESVARRMELRAKRPVGNSNVSTPESPNTVVPPAGAQEDDESMGPEMF